MDLFKCKDKYGEEIRCLNIQDKYSTSVNNPVYLEVSTGSWFYGKYNTTSLCDHCWDQKSNPC